MGLIKAAMGAAGGVMADQWKDFFVCESLDANTLVAKGQKRVTKRGSNTSGEPNIISSGSVISVANGQCMIITEQGKVVDMCAEPGEYTYDASTEPSVFAGGDLAKNIKDVFKNMGKRFTFGGSPGKDQRIYYFNTKEIVGNKYGTPAGVPFHIVDKKLDIDLDIEIRCFGEYSYRIVNPILFYTNVCGNVASEYKRSEIDSQLKTGVLSALQDAFAKVSAQDIRYSQLPAHTKEVRDALNEVLSREWSELRGIEIVAFGINNVTVTDEYADRIKQLNDLQLNAALRDPTMAAARLAGAQAQAMQDAAKNTGGMGAMGAFMGMGMAQNAGGMNAGQLFNLGAQQQAQRAQAAPTASATASVAAGVATTGGWKCSCGTSNTGKFCSNCGKPRPAQSASWTCSCGATNSGRFCSNCGKPKPAEEWTCSCGTVNKGKFCSNCGNRRP